LPEKRWRELALTVRLLVLWLCKQANERSNNHGRERPGKQIDKGLAGREWKPSSISKTLDVFFARWASPPHGGAGVMRSDAAGESSRWKGWCTWTGWACGIISFPSQPVARWPPAPTRFTRRRPKH
jgi:hypothetical protein